ncbi:MAG: hypothetical protein AVDCRST_MAG56-395 [uncultured Cytophagales bacterium]|uniref:Outer membrane protein beta-barrel domain-containing protein n=1 Tax=uncultured Cytophagales bacterium TaxID=158755 RepID=A0A6J4HF72_9SPHI|nr:MAG: hypothetical protein AVDCRST_MAG56-395 [uncultured Cytophagales bacterium]
MFRHLLISFALLAQALPLAAQGVRLGVRAGYSLSGIGGQGLTANRNPDVGFENENLTASGIAYRSGFHAGGYVSARREAFGFEGGLFLSTRGYRYSYSETYLRTTPPDEPAPVQAAVAEDYRAYYLEVPLLARAYVWKGLNLALGLQPALMLTNRFDRDVTGQPRYTRTADDFAPFDVALVAGLGYDLPGGFNVNLTYDSGLLGVDRQLDLYQYHRAFKVSAGYSFK